MTSTQITRPAPNPDPALDRPSRNRMGRTIVAGAAILGTLPYLGLKALWLTGHPVGATDPAMLDSTSMQAFNGVTVGMDVCVILLAIALTTGWGRRLPATAVLLPGWMATGFLLPIVVSILPGALITGGLGESHDLAGWVRPLVYGGFTWQGLFLLVAFALYARDRWSSAVRDAGPTPETLRPLLRATAVGGTVMAALSAVLQILDPVLSGADAINLIVGLANAAFAVAGAAGVLAMARGARSRSALVAGWSGSAAMFAWGLWTAVTTMGVSDPSGGGNPAYGLANLTGLLGGFALAVAGLLVLSGAAASHRRAA